MSAAAGGCKPHGCGGLVTSCGDALVLKTHDALSPTWQAHACTVAGGRCVRYVVPGHYAVMGSNRTAHAAGNVTLTPHNTCAHTSHTHRRTRTDERSTAHANAPL